MLPSPPCIIARDESLLGHFPKFVSCFFSATEALCLGTFLCTYQFIVLTLFLCRFLFSKIDENKKSFYQHLLIKGRSLVLPPFVQKVSLPSTQRLSRKFHQEIGAPFNGRADSVIAYLSTINPPRPFSTFQT